MDWKRSRGQFKRFHCGVSSDLEVGAAHPAARPPKCLGRLVVQCGSALVDLAVAVEETRLLGHSLTDGAMGDCLDSLHRHYH